MPNLLSFYLNVFILVSYKSISSISEKLSCLTHTLAGPGMWWVLGRHGWMSGGVCVYVRRERTCWILGMKQLLRDADGRETILQPSAYHWDVLTLNDERYRRCLLLFFIGV